MRIAPEWPLYNFMNALLDRLLNMLCVHFVVSGQEKTNGIFCSQILLPLRFDLSEAVV